MQVDVLVVGDFRFPGGTSSSILSDVSALADAGYTVGLLALSGGPLVDTRSMHAGFRNVADHPNVSFVPQRTQVTARLCCLHHPSVFETLPALPLCILCPRFILVVHHPPVDAYGEPQYDVARIVEITNRLFGHVDWAPVGPKVRAAFTSIPETPPLTPEDWVNVLDPDMFAESRKRLPSARPTLGRHSRPQAIKWPDDRETFLQAYPDTPDIRVMLMGYGAPQDEIVETRPLNWDVLSFDALPVEDFLRSIRYFSYFHGEEWIEAFGRSILEAMAAGCVCFLPDHFQPLFEDGAIYCEPSDVARHVNRIEAEPGAWQAQSDLAVATVRRKFGPNVAVNRVRALIGDAEPKVNAQPLRQSSVVYLTSNGIGMGHITRCMASARRLSPKCKPTIITMSKAYSVATDQGIDVDYLPYFQSVGLTYSQWTEKLARELTMIFRFRRPDVFVFDGNVPYDALIHAMKAFPEMWKIWQRRPLWRPNVGQEYLDLAPHFDAVIEPSELCDPLDRGLTKRRQAETLRIPPVRFLDAPELLDRASARRILDLDPDIPAFLLQLGSGNNFDTRQIVEMLCDMCDPRTAKQPAQLVFARWRISKNAYDLPDHVRVLDAFPISKFLNGFDGAVALAGYNTFHENISAGLPTLFTSNDHPEHDEQWLRADYAELCGLALSARTGDLHHFRSQFEALMRRDVQDRLRINCARLDNANGAAQAAAYVEGLTWTRKRSPLAFQPSVLAHA